MTVTARGVPAGCHERVKILRQPTPSNDPWSIVCLLVDLSLCIESSSHGRRAASEQHLAVPRVGAERLAMAEEEGTLLFDPNKAQGPAAHSTRSAIRRSAGGPWGSSRSVWPRMASICSQRRAIAGS